MTSLDYSPTCTWIGTDADYTKLTAACCRTSVLGKSYCAEHVWLVYQEGTRLGRRKKEQRQAHNLLDIISDINEVYAELIHEGEVTED